MDARFPTATVVCVRCHSAVSDREADFSAEGRICRSCVLNVELAARMGVDAVSDDPVGEAARAFARSARIKHLSIGCLGVALGLATLGFFLRYAVLDRPSIGLGL